MDALTARVAAFGASLTPQLGAAWGRFMAAGGRQTDRQSQTWMSPQSQPVIHLPRWLWEGLGLPLSAEVRLDLLESAVCGYLHARLADDLVDEGDSDPGAVFLLGRALFRRHSGLLRLHIPGEHPFWTAFDARWAAAEEALLLERSLRGQAPTAAQFEQILDGARPVLLPGLAVLALGDRWGLAGELPRLIDPLLRAHQLLEDLADLDEDRAAGRITHVCHLVGGSRGEALRSGAWDRLFDQSQAELTAAIAVAAELGLPTDTLQARAAHVEQARRAPYAAWLAGLVSSSKPVQGA
jgi:hypothetical protein